MIKHIKQWLTQFRVAMDQFKVFRRTYNTYYQLDADKLFRGDIILSTSFEKMSLFIRLLTCSSYSHAAIYIGNNQYAEAVGLGIRVRSVSTIIKKRIKVIRLKNSGKDETLKKANQAVERANHYLHLPYWVKGVLLISFMRKNANSRPNFFCSHFVAQCYDDVGIHIAGKRKPENISPGRLAKSSVFYDISKYTVKRATIIPKHLVLGEFKTLSDEETKIYQAMYDSLNPVFMRHIKGKYMPPDWHKMIFYISEICIANSKMKAFFDRKIIQIMKNEDFLNFNEVAVEEVIKPMEAYIASTQHAFLPKKVKEVEINHLNTCLKALQSMLEVNEDNYSVYKKQYNRTKMMTFKHLENYQKDLIQNNYKMINLTESALSALSGI